MVLDGEEPNVTREFNYGVHASLSQPNFFKETRDLFVKEQMTFIEVDLTSMTITYYENGHATATYPILSKGREGSWWETPAGLYKIESKERNHFSSFGHVYQPWSMVFQGNFFIHGWPYYPNGTPVEEGYSGGCIRLADDDAERLFDMVKKGTPVLVHEKDFEGDNFLYEPKVPDIHAKHYLIADVKSNTVLASSDLDNEVPIASLTKLMTALIASEYINLDTSVTAFTSEDITSVIPRLKDGQTVSMYSLLQLLLVESSNEAAELIAAQVGRARFVELMNKKAQSLGLTNTTFTDPSGADKGNISTVGDLLRLTQYIFNNRSFVFDLTADQDLETAYTKGEFGELANFNIVEGIGSFIGGKIGSTQAAGETSISLHTVTIQGKERIVAIVLLGSEERDEDVRRLYDYVIERFGGS